MLGLVSPVPSQEIGWEERLQYDVFCVEWGVIRQLVSCDQLCVCSADGIGAPHSPQVRNALNLRSVSVIERARSATDNADDEHAASNGVQRQMSVSSVPQLETVCGNKSWLLQCTHTMCRRPVRSKSGGGIHSVQIQIAYMLSTSLYKKIRDLSFHSHYHFKSKKMTFSRLHII